MERVHPGSCETGSMAEKEKNSGTLPAGDSRLLARFSLALALLIPALIAAHPLANNDLPTRNGNHGSSRAALWQPGLMVMYAYVCKK